MISSRMRMSRFPDFILSWTSLDRRLGVFPVFPVRVRVSLNPAKPLPGGNQFNGTVHLLHPIPLSRIEVSLHELNDSHLHVVTAGPDGDPQGRGGLPFPTARDHHHQPFSFFGSEMGYFHSGVTLCPTSLVLLVEGFDRCYGPTEGRNRAVGRDTVASFFPIGQSRQTERPFM